MKATNTGLSVTLQFEDVSDAQATFDALGRTTKQIDGNDPSAADSQTLRNLQKSIGDLLGIAIPRRELPLSPADEIEDANKNKFLESLKTKEPKKK